MRHRTQLMLLALLAALVYLPGLDSHGVTNWQEGQRLVVAREMQQNVWREGVEALLLPTINGSPYLAKPPLLYWLTLASAEVRAAAGGAEVVTLCDLRLVVALAGVLGVVCAAWAGRELVLLSMTTGSATTRVVNATAAEHAEKFACRVGWWAGVFMLTGLLTARSARIGEIDALLMPLTALGVGAIARAWRRHRCSPATDFAAVFVAAIACVLAALAKGPPALLAIGIAAYGGMMLYYAVTRDQVDVRLWGRFPLASVDTASGLSASERGMPHPPELDVASRRLLIALAALMGVIAAAVSLQINLHEGTGTVGGIVGVMLVGACVFVLAWVVLRLFSPVRAAGCFVAMSRTHPVGVLLAGAAVVWGWSELATWRMPPQMVAMLASQEVEDNLRMLVPGAVLKYLEASSFGVGMGSVMAILALVWLVRERPRLCPGLCICLAWTVGLILVLSLISKGVPRYLTPAWPGMAILGAWMWSAWLSEREGKHAAARVKQVVSAACVVLAAAMCAWYGVLRDVLHAERSPRDLARELAPLVESDNVPVFSHEFATPALDAHLGTRVQPVGDTKVRDSMMGGPAWSFEELAMMVVVPTAWVNGDAVRFEVDSRKRWVVLLRETVDIDAFAAELNAARDAALLAPTSSRPTARVVLPKGKLAVERLPISARFVIDGGRTEVHAVVLRWESPDPSDRKEIAP